mmetsp:Transcript_8579/g.19109  ORF Transcript_8579/g.19109 Transcript_8579/m.19109 type:complete len:93 (+) Transcript_8579:73-351(+)
MHHCTRQANSESSAHRLIFAGAMRSSIPPTAPTVHPAEEADLILVHFVWTSLTVPGDVLAPRPLNLGGKLLLWSLILSGRTTERNLILLLRC